MNGAEIARLSSDGRIQSLYEHTKNVADISSTISKYPNTSKLIAYLHDLGKLSDAFQEYIISGDGERGSVVHAWQGAFLASELFESSCIFSLLLKEIIGFCVTAHHNKISDGVSPDGTTTYFDKFTKTNIQNEKYFFENVKVKIKEEEKDYLKVLFESAKEEIICFVDKVRETYENENSSNFAVGLFVKYIFSCLVDADRLDAYLFCIGEDFNNQDFDWEPLIMAYEENIKKLSTDLEISNIRKSISDKCKLASERETGIYKFMVPTGGGKTLSSLRFGFYHCKKWNKKRIIYVIPYLSIIDQTAENIRNILNLSEEDNVVFEHHSNTMEPEDERAADIKKLTASRWDSPIIITTMVQFLETVMSSKSGDLRKFSHMADSVIIFDEIQSMPIKTVHCFNEVVTFLSKVLNSTVILCSATQPTLESTERENLLLAKNPDLIDCVDDFNDIQRTKINVEKDMDAFTVAEFVVEKANDNGDCLIIVNTKRSALEIFNCLQNQKSNFKIFHLSTSMCSAHRMKIIKEIKNSLLKKEKIICVSTQLIEAGVDISFSCVIRAMAGLDSIAQAAGRCNRNGESQEPKTVYVFQMLNENLDKLPDIKLGKEITLQLISMADENIDLLADSTMSKYYKKFFSKKGAQMDYPIATNQAIRIYDLLSRNECGKDNYFNKNGEAFSHAVPQAFYSADINFSVIESNGKSAIALFGDAENLVDLYRGQPSNVFTKEKKNILQKMQKYSVDLYDWQIKKLTEQYALSVLDEETGIILIDKNYYSEDVGVVLEIVQENLIV